MIIVTDTTPIHYFILIGEAEVLKEMFGRVIIPQAVVDDLGHEEPAFLLSESSSGSQKETLGLINETSSGRLLRSDVLHPVEFIIYLRLHCAL